MRKKEINISHMFLLKVRKTIAIFFIVFLTSCGEKIDIVYENWTVENFSLNDFSAGEPPSAISSEVKAFKSFFKSHPYENDYREIEHSITYEDSKTGDRFYIFDIIGIDDVEVVFHQDKSEGVVKPSLRSSWG